MRKSAHHLCNEKTRLEFLLSALHARTIADLQNQPSDFDLRRLSTKLRSEA